MGARFAYVFLSLTLVAAGIAAGVATWLAWLPCDDAGLSGSILAGHQYPTEFTDACLQRMDGSDAVPLAAGTAEAKALSALLLGVGWLTFVPRLRLNARLKTVVLLPVVPLVWYAMETRRTLDADTLWELTRTSGAIELAGLVAAIVILVWSPKGRERSLSLLGLLAVTGFGVAHTVLDYMMMIGLSDANWDMPPGSGYLTAALMVICGLLVGVLGWNIGRGGSPAPSDNPSGQLVAA